MMSCCINQFQCIVESELPYWCRDGQGEGGKSLQLSGVDLHFDHCPDDACWRKECGSKCTEESQCVGFDYSHIGLSCRLYPVNSPRYGEGGNDKRSYCRKIGKKR